MSVSDRLEEFVIGRVTFPISNYIFNRRGILSQYSSLLRSQSATRDKMREIQRMRIRGTLEYAGKWVPYYRDLFSKIGFDPRDFRDLEDLQKIPPLSREDVVERRLDLVDARWRSAVETADKAARPSGEPVPFACCRGKILVRNTSSGSTGAPTVFYENGSITASNWAAELRLRSWYGVRPGMREARMARVSADYIRNSRMVIFRRLLWNQLLLPGVSLKESDYAFCAAELSRYNPLVIWGFTSALAGLASYLKDCPQIMHQIRPKVLISWAAPLYDHERRLLEEVFCCAVTNVYGAREVGHIAALCPHGALHVNQESLYVETEKGSNEIGDNPRSPAEILATTLTPTPMPFIRYRMGDLGVLAASKCKCGRTLQVIEEFTGRTGEIFTTKDGRMISPNFWCRTFMDPKLGSAVTRFQIIYRPEDQIVIRIVRGHNYSTDMESHLKAAVTRNLYASARLKFEYPDKIEPHISGKYQMVVNECN
jgi:phenylacetate-CoA ligase